MLGRFRIRDLQPCFTDVQLYNVDCCSLVILEVSEGAFANIRGSNLLLDRARPLESAVSKVDTSSRRSETIGNSPPRSSTAPGISGCRLPSTVELPAVGFMACCPAYRRDVNRILSSGQLSIG
jgi:hypothetical protein